MRWVSCKNCDWPFEGSDVNIIVDKYLWQPGKLLLTNKLTTEFFQQTITHNYWAPLYKSILSPTLMNMKPQSSFLELLHTEQNLSNLTPAFKVKQSNVNDQWNHRTHNNHWALKNTQYITSSSHRGQHTTSSMPKWFLTSISKLSNTGCTTIFPQKKKKSQCMHHQKITPNS